MTESKRRKVHLPEFKAKVGLEALAGMKTINQIAQDYGVHPVQVGLWKREIQSQAKSLFEGKRGPQPVSAESAPDRLYGEIGRLKMELDWLKKKSGYATSKLKRFGDYSTDLKPEAMPTRTRLGALALEAALRTDLPHQILVALASQIGEHCQIGQRSENSVIYIDTVEAKRSQGLHFEHGLHSPLYCTSIGKLFLAEMSDEQFDWWLSHTELKSLAPNTITASAELRMVVKNVKRQRWATSNEEVAAGVVGCAVPIRDGEGRLLAGLGISVPSARVSFDQLPQFRAAMDSAASEIAMALAAEN